MPNIMMQKIFILICGLSMTEGRSFPLQRQISNRHEDSYEVLQRNWPALRADSYPQKLSPDYYVPLIDGKPIYIPDDRFNQHPSHTSPSESSFPLFKKPVDLYPELDQISEVPATITPTEISSPGINLADDNYDDNQFSTKRGNAGTKYFNTKDGNILELPNLNKSHESKIYNNQYVDMQLQCNIKKSTDKFPFTQESENYTNDRDKCIYNNQLEQFSQEPEKKIEQKHTKLSDDLSAELKTQSGEKSNTLQEIKIIHDGFDIPTAPVESEQPSNFISNEEPIPQDGRRNDDLEHLDQETVERNTATAVNSIKTQEIPPSQSADNGNLDSPNTTGVHEFMSMNETQVSLEDDLLNSFNESLRSLVFNPAAQSREKFQTCKTPKNESGYCRYVHHCLLPSIVSSLDQFMKYVCIIQSRYVGVCCPQHPVEKVVVKWKENSTSVNGPVKVPKECGINLKTRVVGGLKSDPKEYPWMAALISEVSGDFFCGGALINDRYVLTAAHCTFGVPRNKIIARLGEYDFRENVSTVHQNHKVMQIKRHGQYSRMTLSNDIALLKLAKPVVFNQFVSTICLPEKGKDFANETAILAGWGNMEGDGESSNILMEASLRVMSNKDCSVSHRLIINPSQICTGKENKGACNGDSGGPLMLLNKFDESWEAIGLVSFGRRGCDPKFPTVYTRVTYYLDWIRKHAT